jgi:hypothetical protein
VPGSSVDHTSGGFFQLDDPFSRSFRGQFGATVDDGAAFARAEARPDDPVPVEWLMGRPTPSDVVWTTSVYPFVVSRRVIDLLERGRFTGWDSYPVDLVDKHRHPVPGYAGLMITGRCDPVDLSRSELVVREYPGGWFPKFRGQFFASESWDGSDLFMERADERGATSHTMHASARLVDVLRRARIRNLRIEDLARLEITSSVYTIGLAYRLPRDYEARLAEAYARQGVPRPATV